MSFLSNPTTQVITESYIVFQLYSALVQSMPKPGEVGGIWYKAVYNFLSIIAADFKSFLASKGVTTETTASLTQTTTPGKSVVTEGISTTSTK